MWAKTLAGVALCLVLCSPLVTPAKKDSGKTLEEKVAKMMDLSNKKGLIRMNGNKFKEYVRNGPRDYSVIVMFTALSAQRQCAICKQASDEFHILANSYRYSQAYSDKLFFAMVDFDEGPDVFQVRNHG